MNEWISVKDRLPQKYQSVLVSDGKYIGIGEWYGCTMPSATVYWECDAMEIGQNVTHWMELPPPPET